MNSNITFEGRLAEAAHAVSDKLTEFVVLVNRRTQDEEGNWKDADTTRFVVKAFNKTATKAAQLTTGDRVIVVGSVVTETWQNPQGENRSKQVVLADAIGKSL